MTENAENVTLVKKSNFTQVPNVVLEVCLSGLLTKNEIQVLLFVTKLSLAYSNDVQWVSTSKSYVEHYTKIRACHVPSVVKSLKNYGLIVTTKIRDSMAKLAPDAQFDQFLDKHRLKKRVSLEILSDSNSESQQNAKVTNSESQHFSKTQIRSRINLQRDSENESRRDSENEFLTLYNTKKNTNIFILSKTYLINKRENFFLDSLNQKEQSKRMTFIRELKNTLKKVGIDELYLTSLGFEFWGNEEFIFEANTNAQVLQNIVSKWQKRPSFKNFIMSKMADESEAICQIHQVINDYVIQKNLSGIVLSHFEILKSVINQEIRKKEIQQAVQRIFEFITVDDMLTDFVNSKDKSQPKFAKHYLMLLSEHREKFLFNNEL